jgi:DNA-binding PadR family transcriptional regulator
MDIEFGRHNDPSLLILTSLAAGPRHGYAMIQDVAAFSGVRLEPGTLYGALTRLEARGWIEALPAQDRRRPYALTATGAAALRSKLAQLETITSLGASRLATI